MRTPKKYLDSIDNGVITSDDDHRYKSDLDGGFDGLNFFKPIVGGKRGVTKEEAQQIKDDILNGRKISIK